MKNKIAMILVAICMILVAGCLFACNEQTPCSAHVDRDYDGKCDICEQSVNIAPPCAVHTDANDDGKCDICSYSMQICPPCSMHQDQNIDAKCELCGRLLGKFDTVVTATQPSLKVESNRLAVIDYTEYFTVVVNGVALAVSNSMLDLTNAPTSVGAGKVVCTYNGISATLDVQVQNFVYYSLSATKSFVNLVDEEISSYDFTTLFQAMADDQVVTVTKDMISFSEQLQNLNSGKVFCSFNGLQASVDVNVTKTNYELTLSTDILEINYKLIDQVDLLSFFTAKRNGKVTEITQDMVTTNLVAQVGTYAYTVNFYTQQKTLTVVLNNQHNVQIFTAYPNGYDLPKNHVDSFDAKELFSLYVDGKSMQITDDMISGSLANVNVGDVNQITCTVSLDETTKVATTSVKIAKELLPIITPHNIQIYPSQADFDLTKLFTITLDGKPVDVTLDMLTVPDDILSVDEHKVTINYLGVTKEATVTVIRGVTIDLPHGNDVNVILGTSVDSYDFAGDFSVTINGTQFTNINDYIDISKADFSQIGTSTATLTVPYEGKTYTATITYHTMVSQCEITVLQDKITLLQSQEYNVFDNVLVRAQFGEILGEVKLTTNPDYAQKHVYYATHTAIDYQSVQEQIINVDIYANGVDAQPTRVTFTLQITFEVQVVPVEKVIFVGDTLYPTELFQIYVNDKQIEVPAQNITGKLDCFKAGIYNLTLDYENYQVTSRVVVYDNSIKGTYRTLLRTIATEELEDEEGWVTEGTDSRPIGDLAFGQDGSITVDGKPLTILSAIDSNNMLVQIGSYNFHLYYENGIIVLNPDNSLHMQFIDASRPLIYFNTAIWNIDTNVTINSSSNNTYVLSTLNGGAYSIDAYKITNKQNSLTKWYGLKVHLTEHMNSNTYYDVSWGEVTFAENFEQVGGNLSYLTLNGKTYGIKMLGLTAGIINKTTDTSHYGTYSGTINGQSAKLSINNGYTLTVDNQVLVKLSDYEISNNYKTMGYNSQTGVVNIYNYKDIDQGKTFFSYQLKLDIANKTFTLLPATDNLLGLYATDNVWLFLDGYGGGLVNYDTTSYHVYAVNYNVVGNTVTLTYPDAKGSFAYGESATLTLDEFGNTLKVTNVVGVDIVGKSLVNQHITRGAVVTYADTVVLCAGEQSGRTAIYDMFDVYTSNGKMELADKKAEVDNLWGNSVYCFDMSKINFTKDGFYQFAIHLFLNGPDNDYTTAYYTVQIVCPKQTAQNFGNGIVNGNYSFSIDEYGFAQLVADTNVYRGQAKIDAQGNISAHLNGEKGSTFVKSSVFADGIIQLKATGDLSFVEYFTQGAKSAIGSGNVVLRKVTVANTTHYLLSSSLDSSNLSLVQVNLLYGADLNAVGAILQITNGESVTIAKIAEWGNVKNGLILADNFRGSHTNPQIGSLDIDGFGNVTLTKDGVTTKGTYQINSAKEIMTQFSNVFCVYTIDNGTFEEYNIKLNNTLLENATYTFNGVGDKSTGEDSSSWDTMYHFTTTFAFGSNGVVTITSAMEVDEESIDTFEYSPTYVGQATYSVNGNILTIVVGDNQFTFQIDKVIYAKQLICLSTTLSQDAHGYFAVGAVFNKN